MALHNASVRVRAISTLVVICCVASCKHAEAPPPIPTGYRVSASPAAPIAGAQVTLTAQLIDAQSNPVAFGGRFVSWSKTGDHGYFLTPTSTTDGSGSSTVTFTTGPSITSYTFTATDTASLKGSISLSTVAGPPAKYSVTSSATQPVAGSAVTVTAQLTDGNGNALATSSKTVTWRWSLAIPGPSTPPCTGASFATATSTTDGAGVATVSFTTGPTVCGYAVWATDNAGLTGAVQIYSIAGPAAKLGMRTQPTTAVIGAPFGIQPIVEVQDVNGNLITTSAATVTATVASGTGTLGGTTTVTAVGGVATFSSLSIGTSSGLHTLAFTSAGLTSVTSSSFVVNVAPSRIMYGALSAKIFDLPLNTTASPMLAAYDANGAVLTGIPFTFQARAAAVASVNANGFITAVAPGGTFVVATVGGPSDSVFVQAAPASGPVLRTSVTQMEWKIGQTVAVKVLLDMRGTTLGSATFTVTWPNDAVSGFLDLMSAVDGASALKTQVLIAANGQIRAQVTVPNGATGVLELLSLQFTVRTVVPGLRGWMYLLPLDVVDINSVSITSSVTPLRYPLLVSP